MLKSILSALALSIFCIQLHAQPNFVIIYTDDMGWTGTSVEMDTSIANGGSKSDYYLTPGLDTFATQGMVFSRAYAPAPKCAPSRNSILTGKTPARANYTEVSSRVDSTRNLLAPVLSNRLNPSYTILPEWLQSTGLNYTTAHFGKWHIGGGQSRPQLNGFDSADGNTGNNDGNTGNGAVPDPKTMFDLTTRSKAFIQSAVNAGDPFYLQVSHYAVHSGFEYLQSTFTDYDTVSVGTNHDSQIYGAMTTDTDSAIWILNKFIDSLQLDTNTYVVVMSDNGAATGISNNTPLQRGKVFLWEGGIRTPFMIKGPGISPGTYCHEPIAQWDLYKTIT